MTNASISTGDKSILKKKLLIVDDDEMMRELHHEILSDAYEIICASSGMDAILLCNSDSPDLVLLDIEMPGLNGYEVCRKIREAADIPVIFVTAHQTLEEYLKAYNAGCADIITKPVDGQNLKLKVNLAFVNRDILKDRLTENVVSHNTSDNALDGRIDGIFFKLMRDSLGCSTYQSLTEMIIGAARDLEVDCSVLVRHGTKTVLMSTYGQATSLEQSILEQSSSIGNEFQLAFKLVINRERISILVRNMPSIDIESAEKVRKSILKLAETAEALIELVDMRQTLKSKLV